MSDQGFLLQPHFLVQLNPDLLLQGSQWSSGWNFKNRLGEQGCPLNNNPKLTVGKPSTS